MKTHAPHLVGFIGIAAILLAGCATSGQSSRIQERSAVYNQLNAATQKQIQAGSVERGYTVDMVYMALGKPNKIENRQAADGPVEIWVYKNMVIDSKRGWQGLVFNGMADLTPTRAPTGMGGKIDNIPNVMQGPHNTGNPETGGVRMEVKDGSAYELPDLPTGTLYVFFFQGRVFRLNLET